MYNHQAIVSADQQDLQENVPRLYAEIIILVTSVYRYMRKSHWERSLNPSMYAIFLWVVSAN